MPEFDEMPDDLPTLDHEDGRNKWAAILLSQDEWCSAIVVREGDNMVIRLRYDDGREEIFDLSVRRYMEVCGPTLPPEEAN